MIAVADALRWGLAQLSAEHDMATLDVELLLAAAMHVSRTHLRAWPEKIVSQAEYDLFQAWIQRRQQHEPIAYILGQQEFWSLAVHVTPDTLIPRPETELLVELALEKLGSSGKKIVADLGTGSGAIALALAHERSEWDIYASDRMPAALAVAKQNAERLQLTNIQLSEGSWCAALPALLFDAIISNPPYIALADTDLFLTVAAFEPKTALIADLEGLADLRLIINEARNYLKSGAYLMLEHGYTQGPAVLGLMQAAGYHEINIFQDLAGLDRVTIGRYENN